MRLADERDVPTVYEPAEDSHLLAEAALDTIDGGRVLEVGVGSGYVAGRVAAETDATVLGSDLAPAACRRARSEGIDVVRGDLTRPFAAGSFDTVLFNPPYLPTPPDVEWDDSLEHALSGGPDGRRVIRPFLADVGRVLRSDGRGYLLVSSLTGLDAVADLAADAGMATREIASESFPFERLVVLEITHGNT
ncbi:HemK2/MTQ2 family protein methyltransferase [Natronomonas sp.]|uniref:HemK2/MTQ2 family protein methyltransferase n=1 Tax=Natronomonas sp. TaxID=2184060 RepID=UPI002605D64D|nr:HemK2/MTQ2 family protein methyltransferase [Natronomonas sp.]